MAYRYDVFISYRRSSFGLKWIREEFLPEFEPRLELELGRKPEIFWDEGSVDDGQVPTTKVLHALRDARCLLSVLSGPYFTSAWCSAEWDTFRRRAEVEGLVGEGDTLTLPIRWHDGENYLDLLRGQGPRPRDFTRFRLVGPWRGTALHVEFQSELNVLVERVARVVEAAPAHSEAWPLVDPQAAPTSARPAGEWSYKLGAEPVAARSAAGPAL